MCASWVFCSNCSEGVLAMVDIYSGSTQSFNMCQYKTICVFDNWHLHFWKSYFMGCRSDKKKTMVVSTVTS